MFSARFDKQDEDDQVLDEVEIYNSLNSKRKLIESESDIDNIDYRSQLERQTHNRQMKNSGRKFEKTNSITFCSFQFTELGGSIYRKNPVGNSAFLNNEKDHKFCFL